jgi:very-short-patch-repair endonuclease
MDRSQIKRTERNLAAKDVLHTPTHAEKELWVGLRNRQFSRLKFYRQRLSKDLRVDFYCAVARLVMKWMEIFANNKKSTMQFGPVI